CRDPEVQGRIFTVLGMAPEEAQERFGFLLGALRNGAPPHGGIALGVDRLVMLYAGLTNIRDCIAFPKTAKGTDLMTGAPGTVDPRQLKELHLRLAEPFRANAPAVARAEAGPIGGQPSKDACLDDTINPSGIQEMR